MMPMLISVVWQKGELMKDLIDRQAAISLPVKPREDRYFQTQNLDDAYDYGWYSLQRCIEKLPSAQPEIIRCKDCKYQDENWRRVSVRWLPCMDVRTGSNWYCGSAERGEQ